MDCLWDGVKDRFVEDGVGLIVGNTPRGVSVWLIVLCVLCPSSSIYRRSFFYLSTRFLLMFKIGLNVRRRLLVVAVRDYKFLSNLFNSR